MPGRWGIAFRRASLATVVAACGGTSPSSQVPAGPPSAAASTQGDPRCAETPSDRRDTVTQGEACSVIVGAEARFQQCYRDSISGARMTPGSLSIEWGIAPTGDVVDPVLVSSTFGRDATLAKCIFETLESLRFPTAPRATTIGWTFDFGPR